MSDLVQVSENLSSTFGVFSFIEILINAFSNELLNEISSTWMLAHVFTDIIDSSLKDDDFLSSFFLVGFDFSLVSELFE
jgi:hypothetical protein